MKGIIFTTDALFATIFTLLLVSYLTSMMSFQIDSNYPENDLFARDIAKIYLTIPSDIEEVFNLENKCGSVQLYSTEGLVNERNICDCDNYKSYSAITESNIIKVNYCDS